MKDVRITVRMSEEEHEELKIISIKRKTTMNEIMLAYIREMIRTEEKHEKKED